MKRQTPSNTKRYQTEKKQDIQEAKAQKRIAKEKEKERKKRAGNANTVRKRIIKFDKRQAKYKALVSNAREKKNTARLNSRSGAAFGR